MTDNGTHPKRVQLRILHLNPREIIGFTVGSFQIPIEEREDEMKLDWIKDPKIRAAAGDDLLLYGNAFVVENDNGTGQRKVRPDAVQIIMDKKGKLNYYEVNERGYVSLYKPEHVWHGCLEHISPPENEQEENMKLTKGIILKARDGWDAEVVWVRADKQGFYAVHRPGILGSGSSVRIGNMNFRNSDGESFAVYHWPNGKAAATFTVNEPPTYNGHPADLEMEGYEL